MAQNFDRVTAGVGAFVNQKPEALVVVRLNNAAVVGGKGKFFYLPEPMQAAPAVHPQGPRIRSTVPNLIYFPHQWSPNEKQSYIQLPDHGRYVSIQDQLPHLNQEDVVPINLVMHPRGNYKTSYNFSWPKRTLATIVILFTKKRMEIASMAEWANGASMSADGNTCTVQFYTRGRTQHNYNDTADAIGKKLEVGGILAEIEKKVPQFHGSEADDGTRSWVVIKAILVHEAGDTAVGGPPARPMPSLEPVGESTSQTPTLRMPTSLSAAESARPALPTRPKPPPSSKVKSTHQAQAHPTPGPDDGLKPLISPSAIFIQGQLAAAQVPDAHYDAKVNTSPTKKMRVTPFIKRED